MYNMASNIKLQTIDNDETIELRIQLHKNWYIVIDLAHIYNAIPIGKLRRLNKY